MKKILHSFEVTGMRCIFMIYVLLEIFSSTVYADSAPSEVIQAANDGLQSKLKLITPTMYEEFDLSEQSDFANAKLGVPMILYMLDSNLFVNSGTDAPVSDSVVEEDDWNFPVYIDGEIKCFIDVLYKDGKWHCAGIGKDVLANGLNELYSNYPDIVDNQEYSRKLIWAWDAGKFYILFTKGDDEILLPLNYSSTMNLGLSQSSMNALSSSTAQNEIRRNLKNTLSRHLGSTLLH